MKQYHELLRRILDEGVWQQNRTGVRSKLALGHVMRFDLRQGFPAVTTKRLFWKGVAAELIFFVKGLTDNKWLNERGVHIWDEWAKEGGGLGPVYGYQWRRFGKPYQPGPHQNRVGSYWWMNPDEAPRGYKMPPPGEKLDRRIKDDIQNWSRDVRANGFDQLLWAENELRSNPGNRQIIVSAWNPLQIYQMALPPCHVLFQLRAIDGGLHLTVYQRSCDMFLGVPFNIASYALLCHMLAAATGLAPRELIWFGNDCHIYENQMNQVEALLSREPRDPPKLLIRRGRCEIPRPGEVGKSKHVWIPGSVTEFEPEDFKLANYDPHPAIRAEVAV